MTRPHPVHATIAACLAVVAVLAGGAALAYPQNPVPEVAARPTASLSRPMYGQLADGVWVMVYGNQLFYVGQRGVRSLCPDGRYNLKNGSTLPVLAAHIVPPWVKVGFNPQPEPPGRELFARVDGGRRLVLSQGLLFLEDVHGGPRRQCGDGTYALQNGASVQIVRGVLQNAARLEGFAP